MDGAILVVACTDGTMPQTKEHLLLANQVISIYVHPFIFQPVASTCITIVSLFPLSQAVHF